MEKNRPAKKVNYMQRIIILLFLILLIIDCTSIVYATNNTNATNYTCPLDKITPESIFVSNLLFYSGIGILVAICVGVLIFIYLLLPKRIKTCPVSTLAKAKKIVIPNRINNIVVKKDSKEFSDIISNFDDRRQQSDPQVASITINVYVNNTKYTLQVSMAGWNFIGEERNSRRLLNNIQIMDALSSLLEKFRTQSKGAVQMRKIILMFFFFTVFSICIFQDDVIKANSENGESIKDILAKAENIKSMQYDIIIDSGKYGTSNAKAWEKPPYYKMEPEIAERGGSILLHQDVTYTRISKDKYRKITSKEMVRFVSLNSLIELSKEIAKNTTLKVLRGQVIDGKSTTLVETYVTFFEAKGRSSIIEKLKLWIWNDKGIPLRVVEETNTKDASYITREYKNFIFGDIPDNIFAVPQGATIEESPAPK
jgi:hypothetical protein